MYEKLEKLLNERGISAYKMCKDTGISRSLVSQWKSGAFSPKHDKLKILSDYFDVPMSYFFDDGEQPVYEVSAGSGRINDTAETFKPSSGKYARVIGDSMYPTLHDGDYVRIEETVDVAPSDYALIRINGDELSIKHVEFTDDGVWVRGENPDAFQDRFYTIREIVLLPVNVVGKATEIIQRKL